MGAAQRTSKSSDWGTPGKVIRAVHECLGGDIGLDPCSSDEHNERIRARQYFDGGTGNDGLENCWRGCGGVFCNPPGSHTGVQEWWFKFTGEVVRGIWLGFNMNQLAYLDSNPLHAADWIFIPRKRFHYVGAGGGNPPHNSYLVGVGCSGRALSVAMPGALRRLG